jgi:hypothetical protein
MPPPKHVRGTGLAEYDRTSPVFAVDLDAGVFFWLWEIVEAKSRTTFAEQMPPYGNMIKRAQLAFEAAGGQHEMAEPVLAHKVGKKKLSAVKKRKEPDVQPSPPPRGPGGIKRRTR